MVIPILDEIFDFLMPLFLCVILPVSIVLIVSLTSKSRYNKKIDFLEKCIENGVVINPELLGTEQKTSSSLKKDLLNKLMSGVMLSLIGVGMLIWLSFDQLVNDVFVLCSIAFIAVGIGMLVWYFVGKKTLAEDIQAEQEQLSKQEESK